MPLKMCLFLPRCFESFCLLIVAVYTWGALHVSFLGVVSLLEVTLCCHYQFWKIRSYYLFICWSSPVLSVFFRETQILYMITFPQGFIELFPTLPCISAFLKMTFCASLWVFLAMHLQALITSVQSAALPSYRVLNLSLL